MLIKPFKAQLPILSKIQDTDTFFEEAKEEYTKYLQRGCFTQTTEAAFFIYSIAPLNDLDNDSLGVVALTDSQEFFQNNIKKHENTLSKQEDIQKMLLAERRAAIKPILLTHKGGHEYQESLRNIRDKSEIIIQTDFQNLRHSLYSVTDLPAKASLNNYFQKKVKIAYIADGHHRANSTTEFLKEHGILDKGVLTAYFDFSQLHIGAFHRVASDLDGKALAEFLKELQLVLTLKKIPLTRLPHRKGEIVMVLNNVTYSLHWRREILEQREVGQVILDTHLLSDLILKPILGIKNLKKDTRLKYIEGNKSLDDIVKQCPKNGVLFLLHPISFRDFKTVIDSGGILPPKSTFFEPRLINGFINYELRITNYGKNNHKL